MFNTKSLLVLLLLCSLSIFASEWRPELQKSYFSVKPNNSFSYEFPQTRNGAIIAHSFENSDPAKPYSKFFKFNITSGDASPIFNELVKDCQTSAPVFQPMHYHVQTDTLVYYCAANDSLFIIDQNSHTASASISLGIWDIYPNVKLSTEGMNVNILAMDELFIAQPKDSVLIKIDVQSRKIISRFVLKLNDDIFPNSSVVEYAVGSKTSYVAFSKWETKMSTVVIFSIVFQGDTYEMTGIADFTTLKPVAKPITKLFTMGDFIVINNYMKLYFLASDGRMVQEARVQAKELTPGVFHPAVVLSNDGLDLYVHSSALEVQKYRVVDGQISATKIGSSQDMQIAYANQNTSDFMFSYDDPNFFKILDLQTSKGVYASISSYNDHLLTNTTYTVVQNNTFYIFDLKTDSLLTTITTTSSKYYHNKDQDIVTFLSTACQVTHLDLVSGKLWTSLQLSTSLCPGDVSYARLTEKGNPELVIPTNQSYLIITEAYGQILFNTSSPTDSINVNFDDLSFYYYTATQSPKQVNASFYTFDPQSQQFKLNSTNSIPYVAVKSQGLFPINPYLTAAVSDISISVIQGTKLVFEYPLLNRYNSVTSFETSDGYTYMFFSYFNSGFDYSKTTSPVIYNNLGQLYGYDIYDRRSTTVSGQAAGERSFAFYDSLSSDVSLVRLFNGDVTGPNLISF